MRRSLVVGNWKMNGSAQLCRSMVPVLAAAAAHARAELVVCPPAVHLAAAAAAAASSTLAVGAQDVSPFAGGAYTGEISAAMLRELGCRHAIVGHSERRARFGETDGEVAEKAHACLANAITPIVCVGETGEERARHLALDVVARQVGVVLARLDPADLAGCVIAYEPVWAIGSGNAATPAQAQEMHAFIRACVSAVDAAVGRGMPLLYGGSVKASNAAALFAMPDIDGALVGGASLDVGEFLRIHEAARPRPAARIPG